MYGLVSVFDKNTRRVLSYDVLRQKIAVFTYRSPHFVSPGDASATITQSHGHSVTVSLRDSRRGDKFFGKLAPTLTTLVTR